MAWQGSQAREGRGQELAGVFAVTREPSVQGRGEADGLQHRHHLPLSDRGSSGETFLLRDTSATSFVLPGFLPLSYFLVSVAT